MSRIGGTSTAFWLTGYSNSSKGSYLVFNSSRKASTYFSVFRAGIEFPMDLFDDQNTDEDDDPEVIDDEDDDGSLELSISKAHAESNYDDAGSRIEEQEDNIKLADFGHVMSVKAEGALDALDRELNLPYKTADFQRIAINCAVEHRNVILIKECGSGKMDVALKGSLVMRMTEKEPRGITIILQPLSNLQNEKLDNNIAEGAVLSMAASLSVLGEDKEGMRADLSCSLEELISGQYSFLLAHPESFATPLGQLILTTLQKENLLLMIVIDEFHQGCSGHWDSFRPDMLRLSCGLRIYAKKNAPVIAMTATAKKEEIQEVVNMLGLREEPVQIWTNPVQVYHKYTILQRPANCRGLLGSLDKNGRLSPGLWHLLVRIYVGEFLQAVKEGRKPKRCIMFFRNNVMMGAVYSLLQKLTGQTNPSTAQFAMNHSSLLPPDDAKLEERRDDIDYYLASNKMLLGTNRKEIDLVVFVQPFDMVAALLQGAGRMSRRTSLGFRTSGQVYQLFNSSDLTTSNKKMSVDMRRLCRMSKVTCAKQELAQMFHISGSSRIMAKKVVAQEEEDQEEAASFQKL